ncbi:GNAT family N-acetyltransferase [Streptomyces albidoflavus]
MNQVAGPAVRPVRADEWREAKELRLAALRDPVAPIAFLETYERAVAEPDSFWRERTEGAAGGMRVRQFVAEGPDGRWTGTVTVLVEDEGADDAFGGTVERRQAHLVGVYVRPGCRGAGVIDALIEAAVAWSWSVAEVTRARLYVHEDNARAERVYQRCGFRRSGETVPMRGDPAKVEREMILDRL